MGKISAGGCDDGEGSSNPFPKPKRRRLFQFPSRDFLQDESFQVLSAANEEEQQDDDGEAEPEIEQLAHAEDDDDDDEEPYFDHETLCFAPRSSNPNAAPPKLVGSATTEDGDKSVAVKLTDPEVLDCCVCYEPLTSPVFQCENGHIACSNCCVRLGNKCPMCSMPIGYSRCRAIEKVLDSIKVSCLNAKYGCKETSSYSKKNDHEKECIYLPCLCPHSGCNFVASSKELSLHFRHRHVGSGIHFTYDKIFTVVFNYDNEAIVLQEQNDANLFILHNNTETFGNIVKVSCIGPNSKAGFQYDILARSQEWSLKLQSFTKNIQGDFVDKPSTGFLVIPSEFFGSSGQLKLEVRIRQKGASVADVHWC